MAEVTSLIIRKNNVENVWTHESPSSTIILSRGFFRMATVQNSNTFELTEINGNDNFRVNLSGISVIDMTGTGTPETFTTSVALTTRLRELSYPYFDTSTNTVVNIGSITVQNSGTSLPTGATTLNMSNGLYATGNGATKNISGLFISVGTSNFTLVKNPNNNTAGFETLLQVNDMVVNGWRNSTTFWFAARYTGGNPNLDTSWDIINSISEITLN